MEPGIEVVVERGTLVPQPHGGALRAGGGRPPDKLRSVVKLARAENYESLQVLVGIRDDPDEKTEDRIKAALAIVSISGVTREKPRPSKRATFHVTTQESPRPSDTAPRPEPPDPDPEPESGSRGPK